MATARRTTNPGVEQLVLLAGPALPVQFRLDERTRRCGMAHIAQIRAQLAASAARHEADVQVPVRQRQQAA